MFTTCPKCSLKLVVTAADLRVAQGYVRCGRCSNVFNALAGLSDEQQAVLAREDAAAQRSASAPPEPPAPAKQESPAPTKHELHELPARAKQEPSPAREEPNAAKQEPTPPKHELAAQRESPFAQPPSAAEASSTRAAPTEEPIPDEALEFDASATDVSEVFVESGDDDPTGTFESIVLRGDDAPPDEDASASEPELHELELDLEALVSGGARKAAAERLDDRATADVPERDAATISDASTRTDNAAQADAAERDMPVRDAAGRDAGSRDAAGHAAAERDAAERDAAGRDATGRDATGRDAAGRDAAERDAIGRDVPARNDVATRDTAAQLTAAPASAMSAIVDRTAANAAPAKPASTAPHADAASSSALPPFAAHRFGAGASESVPDEVPSPLVDRWLRIGSAALALILVLQIIHHERANLADVAWLRAPLTAVYSALGMRLVPHWDVGAYEVRQLGAVAGPRNPGALTVRASVKNTARRDQPLPLLRVTMQDRFGNRIAARDVPPSAYLPAASANRTELAAGQRIDAEIAFVDPGPNAVGFEIDACLKLASGRIACANDAGARR